MVQAAAIGSVNVAAANGRLAVVVARTPVSEDEEGNRTVRVTYRTLEEDKAAKSQAPRAVDPTQPGAEARNDKRGGELLKSSPDDLSPTERAHLNQLRGRDAQVRAEENAHTANAGDLAGPTQLTYQRGPDGRNYAIGGSVGISASALSGRPEELQRIGQRLNAAALAAINPSGADQSVARAGNAVQAYGLAEAYGRDPEKDHQGLDIQA